MKKYIAYIIMLSILEILLSMYLTEWSNKFWTYVEHKDFHGFLIQIGVFSAVALAFCAVNAWAGYFITMCAIKWRRNLNDRTSSIPRKDIENLNQRIQQDAADYPNLMLNVVFGVGKAFVYIIVFGAMLIINYNIFYLLIITSYAIVSTMIARNIAKPLITLNYKTQQAEATYRNELTTSNFDKCIDIMFGLAIKTKKLSYFQTFYGQVAIILPILIVAPAYFGSALTLGGLMQATRIMGTLTENMSYGINSFNQINMLLSCKKRLSEIGVI
jgi:putative ATP-binding cassette transporter